MNTAGNTYWHMLVDLLAEALTGASLVLTSLELPLCTLLNE